MSEPDEDSGRWYKVEWRDSVMKACASTAREVHDLGMKVARLEERWKNLSKLLWTLLAALGTALTIAVGWALTKL